MIEETTRQALAETPGNETILLVEDEEVNRLMLVEILTLRGYAVLEAGRGADALALAQGAKPVDLLVTDMSMPGMTGWDLAKKLRTARPGLPVLFISGHNDHETARWGAMEQPVEHLSKPFSMEAFLHAARRMLDLGKKSAAERPSERAGAAAAPWPEALRRPALDYTTQWIVRRQGSPGELIRGLEEELGWPARHILPDVLAALRAQKDLPVADRKFLNYTLNEGAVREALAGEAGPNAGHQSSLDELFARSRQYRRTRKFAEAVEFISKFRDYSPFNNMLVFLQNPLATYFATASHWHKAFRRTIKDEARGLVILAPRSPVLMVYDIADTEGPPLPDKLQIFTQTSGPFNPMILERTLKNAERDGILVERKAMGALRGSFATARAREGPWKMRIGLRQELEPAAAYAVLCHELGHIYLGHLGADKDGWWPYRVNLPQAVTEMEAEAVAYIVCRRTGLKTHSAEYLSSFVEEEAGLESISLDLVSRAAARIEDMGRRLLPPRQ